MNVTHFLSPDETAIAGATAAGTFVALLLRRPGYVQMLSWFVIGQLTSFYFVVPIALYFMMAMAYYRPLGFMIGAIGMLIWSFVFSFTQKFVDDPLGTIGSVWRLWKGESGGTER